LPQPGVPQGKIFEFRFEQSRIFPGTARKITVYVPAQYTADQPACLYVGLDGLGFEAPVVFDNLIHQHAMPVTIAIGIAPGVVTSADSPHDPRFNRSLEFDGLNANLSRFLIEEVLPEVERRGTPDGLAIHLSTNPDDRAVGGGSTGAIGAFTLAWEHPDSFRRVFSAIGTYVGMRGGDRYPVLVRKTEPKPIRIFMEDGSNDEWMGGPEVGDWWMANQTMERALEFAGYQVQHIWGEGSHSGKHATAIFPEAMRWLWSDWPAPIAAGLSKNLFLNAILQPGASWERVNGADPALRTMVVNPRFTRALGIDGREYESDSRLGTVSLVRGNTKSRTVLDTDLKGPTGIAVSPDGVWLAVAESKTHWGFSYRIQPDGTIQDKQRFYWFHVPDDADDSGAGSWVMDREGRLYAATRMGVQVFDRNGRVRAILPGPGGALRDLSFGGPELDWLYVRATDGSTYRRKMKVPGVAPGAIPIELPAWGAG
jgi:enterochelin esterase-like enzyme